MTEQQILLLIYISLLWSLPWKGFALWKAAKHDQKIWFIALFLVNTLAVLEILYIFIFSPKERPKGIKGIFQKIGIKK